MNTDTNPTGFAVPHSTDLVSYDQGTGVLTAGQESYYVRGGVVEQATREAIIAELERLGYVVLGPYPAFPL